MSIHYLQMKTQKRAIFLDHGCLRIELVSVNMTQSCSDGESQDNSIRTSQSMMFFHYCSLFPHVFTFMYFSCSFLAFFKCKRYKEVIMSGLISDDGMSYSLYQQYCIVMLCQVLDASIVL